MELIPEKIEQYIRSHSEPVSPLLEELERETRERTSEAQMLSGRVEGRLLKMLIQLSGSKTVVEIGTFTGYSALMMAEGLPEDGELYTFEVNEEYARMALGYFERSPHAEKIKLVFGNAIDMIKEIRDKTVDFIFIDADKTSYPLYYEEGLRILRGGGLIAVDNTLWSGRVLDPRDDDAKAIALFNETVRSDSRVEKVLLSVRDGVTLIRKK